MKKHPLSQRTDKLTLSAIREVVAKVDAARQRGIQITSFSAGRPDFDTPQHIKAAAQKALDDGMVHYTPSTGIQELREAVCKRFQNDYLLKLNPEEVLMTTGSTEAIYIGMQSILNPGDAFGPAGEGHIRMAYCLSVEEIEKAMARVRAAINTL